MLSKKTKNLVALVCATLMYSSATTAKELTLALAEPEWTFLIQNNAVNPRALLPSENSFLYDLQPLLKAKNYQKVSEKLKHFTPDEESGAMLLLRGQIAMALEQFSTAKTMLEKATIKEPELAPAHNALALTYLREGAFEKARPHLQKAIELGKSSAQLIGQLAYVNMQLGHPSAAVAGFRQAAFLDATNKDWQQGLLFSLVRSKSLAQASALVEKILEQSPQDKELWMLRSQIALQSGDNLQAVSSLESAIQLGEKTPDNLMTAIQLHLTTGSPKRAVELLTHPALLNKSIKQAHQHELIQITKWLAAEQQWDNLQALLTRSKTQSISKELNVTLAVTEARLDIHKGEVSKAEKLLKNALKLAPTQGEALMEFAKLLRDQQRYIQAKHYYLRAEALPSHREPAMLGRAKIAIEQGQYSDALHLIGQVAKENPKRTDLVSTIATLKNLVRNDI